MEISVNGTYLDLIQDKDITMNFTIQQTKNVNQRLVDFSSTFAIPKTQHNINVIAPLLTDDLKIQNVIVTFDSGFQLDCVIYVERETELKFGNVYSVRVVSKLADMLKKIQKDTLGVLAGSQYDFKYIFRDDSSYNVPIDPDNGWFISAPNRNGDEYDDTNYPVYSARMIDGGHSDMYIGISVAKFLDAVFSYYQIPKGFTDSTEIMDGVTISDVYIFFSTQFITSDDRTLEFNLTVDTDDDGNQITKIVSPPDATRWTDKLQQLTIQENKVTGTADTIYDINVSGSPTFKFSMKDSESIQITPNSGKIVIQLSVLIDGATQKNIKLVELTNPDTEVTFSGNEVLKNIKLQATSEIEFKITTKFIDFCIIDGMGCTECNSEQSVKLDYTENGFPNNLSIPMPPGCPDSDGNPLIVYLDFVKTGDDIEITMTDTQHLSPATRLELTSSGTQMEIETVSMSKTLDATKIKVIDVVGDILKRFNIGFFLKKDGTIGLSTFKNRYDTNTVIEIADWDDGFEVNYLDNSLGKFSYKSKVFEVKDMYFTDIQDNKYVLGDVVDQDFGGEHNENISLSSGIITDQFYKEDYRKLSDDEFDMLSVRNASTGDDYPREFFGIPYNEEVDDDLGDFFLGFLSDTGASDNIYIPVVQLFDYNDGYVEINKPVVTFTKDAKIIGYDDATGSTQPLGNPVSLRTPLSEKNGINLKLGDDTNHEVDPTTTLYENFIPIFKRNRQFVDIKAVITSSKLDKILDGGIMRLFHANGDYDDYYPTSVNGVLMNRDTCVAEIKMIEI